MSAWALVLGAGLSVFAVDEAARLRRGEPEPTFARTSAVSLDVFRGESVAFQVVVEAGEETLAGVRVAAVSTGLPYVVSVAHFVPVRGRSRNDHDEREALAFTPAARPPDAATLGLVPDPLVPVGIAPSWLYPATVERGERAVFFVEAHVAEDADVGERRDAVAVTVGGEVVATLPVHVRVHEPVLPYRAVSAFAYYEWSTLARRFVDAHLAERRVVQMLHAHHLDVLVQLTEPEHVERVRGALDGTWFTRTAGYEGPGLGVPASLAAVGAYGTLREPTEERLAQARRVAARIPREVSDVFVYAVDETCDSPRGPRWRALLRDRALWPRVLVGHTCHLDPSDQDVDIVMVPAQAFDPDSASAARAQGKRVWIYNGQLPHASPPVVDVPLPALALNGWIAAAYDVDRWFYWETTFWEDGNRGGRGPTDVFANVETFHNADGDTSLYDGLLVFPGRTPPRLGVHDLGYDGPVASLRLKSLRRGLEDAALIALASQVDPVETERVTREVVGAALDEVDPDEPHLLLYEADALAIARGRLRAIALRGPVSAAAPRVERALARHRELRALGRSARARPPSAESKAWVLFALPVGIFGAGGAVVVALDAARRRRRPRPS